MHRLALALAIMVAGGLLAAPAARAATNTSQNPQTGGIGLEGRISTDPPTRAATISTPGNGASFNSLPITVAGLCPAVVLVKIFDNNVFVGSAMCSSGSYSLQINLFGGNNQLVARVYDALDQAGPDSNLVTVNYNDGQFAQFGTIVSLTSLFARRGANPGDQLSWPLILSGGTAPYALSVDWGDGTPAQLLSAATAGDIIISHKYTNSGIYKVIVRATDKNSTSAFLQLVAVADGAVQQQTVGGKNGATTLTKTIVLWWPVLVILPLLFVTFWLGKRHETYVLRRELDSAKRQ